MRDIRTQIAGEATIRRLTPEVPETEPANPRPLAKDGSLWP